MELHTLMSQFLRMDYALVGGGVKHPRYPNTSLKYETETFFKKYPQLQKDKHYVDFIEAYAGAFIDYPNHEFSLSIYGLWSYVTNILFPDEPLIEEDRYFRFAELTVQPTHDLDNIAGASYYFDMNSTDTLIYKRVSYTENGYKTKARERYTDSFLEWLKMLISVSGRLETI